MVKHTARKRAGFCALKFWAAGALAGICLLAAGCGGPQIKMLADEKPKALARDAKVDVFVGKIQPPYTEVAYIESEAYPYVDQGIKIKQLEQLKTRARKLGADTVHDVRILTKHVQGYSVDERVPFPAWQQGRYDLYFMRGEAVKTLGGEPATLAQAKPEEGWMVEQYKVPQRNGDSTPTTGTTQAEPAAPETLPVPTAEPQAKATPAPAAPVQASEQEQGELPEPVSLPETEVVKPAKKAELVAKPEVKAEVKPEAKPAEAQPAPAPQVQAKEVSKKKSSAAPQGAAKKKIKLPGLREQ